MTLVALHDGDNTRYPNLALMKLSAWHKSQGDHVEWFNQTKNYNLVYSSKVFTFTECDDDLPLDVIKGGTGYNNFKNLPEYIEHMCPDYPLYKGLD